MDDRSHITEQSRLLPNVRDGYGFEQASTSQWGPTIFSDTLS